jgi:hypothetical protein
MNATLDWDRTRSPSRETPKVSTDQVSEALRWALASDKVPNQWKISLSASVWFLSVEAFHLQEDEALVNGKYETCQDEHRYVLSALIEKGEKLVLAAKQNGIDSGAPFKLEDLQAAVESLHSIFHGEYRNDSSERIKKQIEKLFPDVEEPKD